PPRRGGEVGQRVPERVLLAREALDEIAADDFAAVLHAQERVAQRRPVAARDLARHHAVPGQQQLGAGLLALLRRQRLLLRQRGPPADRRQMREHAARLAAAGATMTGGAPLAVAPGRSRRGYDRAERVGRRQTCA